MNVIERPSETEVVVNDRETEKNFARGGSLGRESHGEPGRAWNCIFFGDGALFQRIFVVDGGTSKIVCIVLANKSLVLIITVNDEGRQLIDTICLIHHFQGLVVNRIQVVIDDDCLLRRIRVNELEEWIRCSIRVSSWNISALENVRANLLVARSARHTLAPDWILCPVDRARLSRHGLKF